MHRRGEGHTEARADESPYEGSLRHTLSVEDEVRIITFTRRWDKHNHADPVLRLINTGGRLSELRSVTAKDVDIRDNRIAVQQAKTGESRRAVLIKRLRGYPQAPCCGLPTTASCDRARDH